MTVLSVPDPCLLLLIGAAGAGKSTLAARCFAAQEVLSSDAFRALVCGDPTDQGATGEAFKLLHAGADGRLRRRALTVIDATSIHPADRAPLAALAKRRHLPRVAIVLHPPLDRCLERNRAREHVVPEDVVRRQHRALDQGLSALKGEGFERILILRSTDAIAAAAVRREPLPCDRRGERGPFDIVGDVHGCDDELGDLLATLGYDEGGGHPERRLVFVGDLVDRGPQSPAVLRRVMGLCAAGRALCVAGNHDNKLLRALSGRDVQRNHGLDGTLRQLGEEPAAFTQAARAFLHGLPSHLLLDGGALVVVHAGLREDLQGRQSRRVQAFCLYGDPTGQVDALGRPIRRHWEDGYRGEAAVVYGHTVEGSPAWRNNTLCVDTGCVFGGELSALRWPERERVSVPARRRWWAEA